MSLDFQAFFRTKPKALPQGNAGEGWVLNVEAPLRIEPEDLPPGLLALIDRARWQVDIHFEGVASGPALEALSATADALVQDGAAVLDLQTDTLRTAAGEQKLVNLDSVDTGGSGYSLHIFFDRADTVTAERMGRLLTILEEELPEALPHRYDHIEPPQHRWAEGGREAFLGRWDRQDCPFWIGKTPASYVFASFDYKPSRVPPAFRAGRFNFQFRAKLGEQPAKLLGVLRVAERFAIELDAFYTGLVAGNEIHGPYWKGLIPTNHLLLILGEPLFALWPEFDALSSPLGDQHRRAGGSDLGTVSLRPPEAMCYPQHQPRAEPVAPNIGGPYAARFPFPKLDPYLG